jgi:hypothetical protein
MINKLARQLKMQHEIRKKQRAPSSQNNVETGTLLRSIDLKTPPIYMLRQ